MKNEVTVIRRPRVAQFLTLLLGVLLMSATQSQAALAEALETAFEGAATQITTNVSDIAVIAVPVLAAILAMAAVWKLAKKFFT